jgi:membrane-bound serine protease (ClpP class)
MSGNKKVIVALLVFIACAGLIAATEEEKKEEIHIIPVQDGYIFIVDLGLSSFVKRAVREAEKAEAVAIIFDIETFGGRADAAIEIKDIILETELKTIAFVRRGISAGALIALAAQEIVMAPGSTIGAATPVAFAPAPQGEEPPPMDEKTLSFIRAEFKATAEVNNHSKNLAVAMVDPRIELKAVTIDGRLYILTPKEVAEKKGKLSEEEIIIETVGIPEGFSEGKLLTLTADEAVRFGLAHYKVAQIENIPPLFGMERALLTRATVTWSENLVRFLTHPIISSLLLTLGILGLIFELRIPGWGVGGTFSLISLALFFGGRFLAGMAEWAMILVPILFVVGIALLALEIFVIPGFGVAGISGIIAIVVSIFLALIGDPLPPIPGIRREYIEALQIISYSFIAAFVITILSLRFIPQTNLWKRARHRLVLVPTQASELGYRATPVIQEKLIGKEGIAETILRPAGRAKFDKDTLSVVTEGEFINAGEKIKIINVEGNRIVVEAIEM